ncbi:Stk1 family PASTA domain-containing Ser/Thr kinase [Sporosarcina pasteurii]|uniref:Serine/threonine-protein kinase PrkC n=1 Tax=Sporosarcina pasteurii TaxID=1474 RepID=A0A380BFM0_SPOPA|nr:Stk1 family PASTA domain-containing Ser/Thr kinase [Sporosarcina pasteurii]MDS9470536.1 Stk1 family PASTA domain-containing Ser/Thr kinase [Sporosarcina pasteurii]QBQ05770.1 Stk1 family PASTA domain-containing Ser/Thr kinase [Sporosarcina pasteurii]SUJ00618.1 Serine/threonine-protein kinase PrkC [Sporosarcina pasteurii]
MIGKRIGGRYEVLSYIGGGGMSRVYLAHDVILGRDVAIKVLNYDFSNEEELKRRFMREALSATSLTHPNIVDIFDVGEDGDIHYLVMEYIDGQTLKEFIVSQGPLSPEEALPIMKQLVSAISNAHYNGIVHRDIKPQNILMDNEGNVKITDFGIAMALNATAHTKTNSVLGTVHYLSPEQARGGMATKKSDIYSVGIVFYELLTGKLPFSGESAVSIALKHLQEETPSVRALFPSIPQSVENVILKATAKESAVRYSSADEMQEDLATVLSQERANEEKFTIPFDDEATRAIPAIVEAPAFGSVEQTIKHEPVQEEKKAEPKKKRKKWPFIVGGLTALVIIGLLIYFLPSLLGLKKIEVPDVVEMTETEAIKALEEDGFIVQESIEEHSDDIEAGKVIKTYPEAGKERPIGTEITLYVSIGKDLVAIENYIGDDFKQVASLLANYGYRSIEPNDVYSDEPEGTIIGQDPEPGTEINPNETDLVFTVSKGKEMLAVPDLSGLSETEVKEQGRSLGFEVSIDSRENSDTVAEGHVLSQNRAAGTHIEKGGVISVVISKGTEPKPVQHITHRVTIEYLEDETTDDDGEQHEKTPQIIRIYVQDRNHSMADLYDEFSITENDEVTIKMELEEDQRGAYRITRDDTLIEEKKFDYGDAD